MSRLTTLVDALDNISYQDIPPEALRMAKFCLADSLGVFLAGRDKAAARLLRQALGNDAVLGDTENLAYWIGGATRLLDLDDGHRFAMGHPGVPICSAVLAVGRELQSDGRRVLEAIVKAYEVYGFLGRSINPTAYLERGFDATCVCGAGAAAAACGVLHGLRGRALVNAIAIACSLTGGLNQYVEDGSSPKYLCAGWGAKLGISACKLAMAGLTGPEEIVEGRLGFCHAFSNDPHLSEPAVRWEIKLVYLKKYSCVRRIHATLDCVEEIFAAHALTPEDIRQVRVYGGRFIASAASYSPPTEVKAQTSVPYTVALLMQYGEVTLERIEDNLGNRDLDALSRKVAVLESEEFNRLTEKEPSLWGAVKVEVETVGGETHTLESHVAVGDPEKPFAEEVLRRKFLGLAANVLENALCETVWQRIGSLEAGSVADLPLSKILN